MAEKNPRLEEFKKNIKRYKEEGHRNIKRPKIPGPYEVPGEKRLKEFMDKYGIDYDDAEKESE